MKKVYIISHSHLDREWYMAYEQHHMRVVELFDEIIDSFENDPSFKYFHLDGQTIPIDDYLEVKPQNRGIVEKLIAEGKLRIGPFYILQDDFLISSESNVRNALIGMKESKKYGDPVMLGYFPDTFGNMGQTPQMMQKMGIDVAAFGRGVKPTGFNNAVSDSYSSQFSEMNWQGPDGSEILGILFANWYSNGNEIPAEKEAAIKFWDTKLADAEKFASTDHLLMMNGCDHQPLQKDVGAAIALANELYPDYEFIHSNFEEYLTAVQKDLPADLGTVLGELTSQETQGWYTLANTASSRVYLKKENVETQAAIENIAEPLASLASIATGEYPKETLEYAWKYLLQNHPHDSICGCSVDEVHREMMTRFAKAREVADYVTQESLTAITQNMDTSHFSSESFPFVVANTSNFEKTGEVEIKVEVDRIPFSQMYPQQAYETLEKRTPATFQVLDSKGNRVPAVINEPEVSFGYDLPKDRFRIPYMAKYVKVKLYLKEMKKFTLETFALTPVTAKKEEAATSFVFENGRVIETEKIQVKIEENGSLTYTNKLDNQVFENQLIFEDVGDIGNEYIFKQSNDFDSIVSTDFPHTVEVLEESQTTAKVQLTHHLMIPTSAEELLTLEQEKVIGITERKSKRGKEETPFVIQTILTVFKDSCQVHFETTMENTQDDHRVRVLFPSNIQTQEHTAESIFEAVKRPNTVSSVWENPTNPQHQHAFVNVQSKGKGLTIGNVGMNEYEVFGKENTIALTLLRCTGELGDWGYFPTPEAQCHGKLTLCYSLESHSEESYFNTLQRAVALKTPFSVKQTSVHTGKLPANVSFVSHDNEKFVVTAVKQAEKADGLIVRGYHLDNETTSTLNLEVLDKKAIEVDLLEEAIGEFSGKITPAEILTTKWSE